MKRIKIVGERCSGTTWLAELVKLNFECSMIWQWNKHFRHTQWPDRPRSVPDLTLVIVRDRISWLQSFHRLPHHVPDAVGVPFGEFIRMPIRSYMGPRWRWFYAKWVRRSIVRPEWLVEEHENPMALRSDKLHYALSLREIFPRPVVYLTMEGLRANTGKLAELIDCPQRHDTILPVRRYKGKRAIRKFRPKSYPPISDVDRQWIDEHTDFELEERYRSVCEV